MNVHGNAIKRGYSTGKEEMKIKKKKEERKERVRFKRRDKSINDKK